MLKISSWRKNRNKNCPDNLNIHTTHATIVPIFWDNCSKTSRPNLNGEHFEKGNLETAVPYNSIFLCQITICLESSRLWNEIWPKERMTTILKNRNCVNTIFICSTTTSNSCGKCHVIWRIINFRSKFWQKSNLSSQKKFTIFINFKFSKKLRYSITF